MQLSAMIITEFYFYLSDRKIVRDKQTMRLIFVECLSLIRNLIVGTTSVEFLLILCCPSIRRETDDQFNVILFRLLSFPVFLLNRLSATFILAKTCSNCSCYIARLCCENFMLFSIFIRSIRSLTDENFPQNHFEIACESRLKLKVRSSLGEYEREHTLGFGTLCISSTNTVALHLDALHSFRLGSGTSCCLA